MIKLERLMSSTPIPVDEELYFYQPTILEIVDMGEDMYWSLLKLWDLERNEMLKEETEYTKKLTDFELWSSLILTSEEMKERFAASVDLFFHTKVEFLLFSNTIVIGENDSRVFVTEQFYQKMKELVHDISSFASGQTKDEQFKETDDMTPRQKELIRKMKENQKRLNEIKNKGKNSENRLVNQIISLVAIGHYTFEQVYEMTYIQLIYLLEKYVSIQQYELMISLSPYMDNKKSEGPKHWLD